jgi:ABC-type multidrug transport system fused ATPase/permease subunit
MLLLLRLLNPLASCQDVTIDGLRLSRINRTILRQRIIVVPQEAVFLPGVNSIKFNLDPLGLASDEECLAVLKVVGLSGFVESLGGIDSSMTADNLSAGQQQLFSLGRAVFRRRVKNNLFGSSHGILLLDEMNSKLDNDTDRVIQEVLRQEFDGYTMIIIAHRLDVVVNLCDRVLVMEKGSVVEDGGPKELIATENSLFSELWKENSR